ncbi:unnamed protein product [Meloidogyne enterolobii]|uniref:Uncharacterized protein n=1 Tax=Meloidogyne enterolobii TaxID=390850 RepID=A0ACB0XVH6_MELEN
MEFKKIFELFFDELIENKIILKNNEEEIIENKRLEIIEEKFKKYREEIEKIEGREGKNLEEKEEKIKEKLENIYRQLDIEFLLVEKLKIIIENKSKEGGGGIFVSKLKSLQEKNFRVKSENEFFKVKKRMRELFGEYLFSELEIRYSLLFRLG